MLLSFFFLLGFGLGRTTGRFIKTTDELHTKDGDLGEEWNGEVFDQNSRLWLDDNDHDGCGSIYTMFQ